MKLFWFKEINQKKMFAASLFCFPPLPTPLSQVISLTMFFRMWYWETALVCVKCLSPMGLAMSLLLSGYSYRSEWEKLVSPKHQLCVRLSTNIAREVALFHCFVGLAGPKLTL